MTKTRAVVQAVISGTSGSIVVGVVFYGVHVFNVKMTAFQFVSFGAAISLLLGLAKVRSVQLAPVAFIVVWAFTSLLARSMSRDLLIRDGVFALGLTASAYLGQLLAGKPNVAASVWMRMAVRVAALWAGYFLAGMVMCVVVGVYTATYTLYFVRTGLLLAAGTVGGIEVGRLVLSRAKRAGA
jgi:hypothetical protein